LTNPKLEKPRYIRDFLKKNAWKYVVGISILFLVDYLQVQIPGYMQQLIDEIKYFNGGMDVVKQLLGAILLVSVGIFGSRFLWRFFIIGTSRGFEKYTRNRLFSKLLRLTSSFFDRVKVGDIMARMTNDVNASRMMLAQAVIMIADAALLGTMSLYMMVTRIDWRLTLVGMIPLPFLVLIALGYGRSIHDRFQKVQESFSDLTDTVQETLDGVRVVKSYSIEPERRQRFGDRCKEYYDKSMHLIRLWGLFFPLIELFASMGFVLALWYGGRLVVIGSISLGQFVAFTQYLGMLVWPMIAVGWVVNVVQRGRASYKRLMWIEEQKPDVVDPLRPKPANLSGEIHVRNLDFHYPGSEKKALQGITVQIRPGQTVAFVGKTGSGKSTLARLLVKLYSVPSATIFIDGEDIHELSMKDIREQVAYVPQETFLFSTTIEENIAFSSGEYSSEEVETYARLAAVHRNIEEFPQGYQTIVGERGITLSGGQKQRVAIARALMKRTPVVILDDCLSAVDTETEMKILESLKSEIKDRTTILISHRLKAVASADQILVFENGKILESGTHPQLLEKKGLYARLYEKQLIEETLERDEVNE